MKDAYGLTVEVSNIDVLNCNLTATFDHASEDEIVNMIAETFGLKVEKHGRQFLLKGDGCGFPRDHFGK